MRTKLLALALAAMVAIGTGGIVAANTAGSDTDEQSTTTPDPASTATVTADGYAFAVVDHDDWFTGDRADDRETVASLIADDEDAGEKLRSLYDGGEKLRMDVYGSLQQDAASAHVRIY